MSVNCVSKNCPYAWNLYCLHDFFLMNDGAVLLQNMYQCGTFLLGHNLN